MVQPASGLFVVVVDVGMREPSGVCSVTQCSDCFITWDYFFYKPTVTFN